MSTLLTICLLWSHTSKVFMAPLLRMWCIYWQRAVTRLQMVKCDWCCFGMFANIYHQPNTSTHFNVCITVIICCWAGHPESASFQQSVAANVHVIPTCTRAQVSYTCVSGIVLLAGHLDTVLFTLRYICNMYSFVLSPF